MLFSAFFSALLLSGLSSAAVIQQQWHDDSVNAISFEATSIRPMAPAPTQPDIASNCNAYYQVKQDDTCLGIQSHFGNFTLDQFYAWNPAVGSNCQVLLAGYYVCIGTAPDVPTPTSTSTPTHPPSPIQSGVVSPCKTYYQAVAGDTCVGITTHKFTYLSVSQFVEWNPAVGTSCTSLLAGYYYCVAIPSTITTVSTTITSTTNPAATTDPVPVPSSSSSSSPPTMTTTTMTPSPTATKPEPRQPGTIGSCTEYHRVAEGDTCVALEHQYKITDTQFHEWNSKVGTDCSTLWLGYYVCVGV